MTIIEFETPTLNDKGEVTARTRCTAEQITEELGRGIGLDLLVIPSGMFQMGSPHNIGNPDEHPQHFVTVKSFRLGKFLVTQGQWRAVMGKLPPCRFKGDDLPVERVSWEDARRFCQQLAKKTGRNYQLPSETQWEYACRAGTTSPFSFGETITIDVVNFNGEHTFRAEPRGRYIHVTTPGGTFPPNAFGLYDMHGDLWEWCADNWLDDYSSSPRDGSSYQNKDSTTASSAAGRGMSRRTCAAAQRACGCCSRMPRRSLGSEWFVMQTEILTTGNGTDEAPSSGSSISRPGSLI